MERVRERVRRWVVGRAPILELSLPAPLALSSLLLPHRSKTTTFAPATASWVAAARPPKPAPTTTAS